MTFNNIGNLNEETRSGYTVTAQSKQVWNIQIEMAKALLEVCERHRLKIWAVSGSMLGAVRHKGFIPWDDDIDFLMFREDYDKLLAIAQQEFKAPLFFQTAYSEEGYYRGHAQIRYDNTAMILPYDAKWGCTFHQGIFIDIFVADGFPEDDNERKRLIRNRDTILSFLWTRRYKRRLLNARLFVDFIISCARLKGKALWPDRKLYSYLEDLHRANAIDSHDRHCSLMFGYLPRWVRRKEWFDDTVWLPFEQVSLPVPARYDEILTHEYGDYQQFVVGGSCHGESFVDTEHSYEMHLPKLSVSALSILLEVPRQVVRKLKRRFS